MGTQEPVPPFFRGKFPCHSLLKILNCQKCHTFSQGVPNCESHKSLRLLSVAIRAPCRADKKRKRQLKYNKMPKRSTKHLKTWSKLRKKGPRSAYLSVEIQKVIQSKAKLLSLFVNYFYLITKTSTSKLRDSFSSTTFIFSFLH